MPKISIINSDWYLLKSTKEVIYVYIQLNFIKDAKNMLFELESLQYFS